MMINGTSEVGDFNTASPEEIERGFRQFVPGVSLFLVNLAISMQDHPGETEPLTVAMTEMESLFEPFFNLGEADAVAAYWAAVQFNLMRKNDEQPAEMSTRMLNEYAQGTLNVEKGDFRRCLRMFYCAARSGLGFVPVLTVSMFACAAILASKTERPEEIGEMFEPYFDLANERGPEDLYEPDYDWWYMGFFNTGDDSENDIIAVLGGDRKDKWEKAREARASVEKTLNEMGRKTVGYKFEPAWVRKLEGTVN